MEWEKLKMGSKTIISCLSLHRESLQGSKLLPFSLPSSFPRNQSNHRLHLASGRSTRQFRSVRPQFFDDLLLHRVIIWIGNFSFSIPSAFRAKPGWQSLLRSTFSVLHHRHPCQDTNQETSSTSIRSISGAHYTDYHKCLQCCTVQYIFEVKYKLINLRTHRPTVHMLAYTWYVAWFYRACRAPFLSRY